MKIDILGSSFTIQSDQDPAYLREVSNYYMQRVDEVKKSVSTSDPVKIAILTGLLIIDDLFKTKSIAPAPAESAPEHHEAARITRELIQKLDQALSRAKESDG